MPWTDPADVHAEAQRDFYDDPPEPDYHRPSAIELAEEEDAPTWPSWEDRRADG